MNIAVCTKNSPVWENNGGRGVFADQGRVVYLTMLKMDHNHVSFFQ